MHSEMLHFITMMITIYQIQKYTKHATLPLIEKWTETNGNTSYCFEDIFPNMHTLNSQINGFMEIRVSGQKLRCKITDLYSMIGLGS